MMKRKRNDFIRQVFACVGYTPQITTIGGPEKENSTMNFSKTLAVVAIGGILAGCGGGAAAGDGAATPADGAAAGEKHECKANGKCGGEKPADAKPADGAATPAPTDAAKPADAPK
jgi:hypothetical protein